MATDLRKRKIPMPVIPSAATVNKRLAEVRADARKLEILLKLASELEAVDAEAAPETSEAANG